MLSRVAESVYWMSRYIERAENVARFVDVTNGLALGNDANLLNLWSPLVYTTGDQKDFEERYDGLTRENVLKFLLFDEKNPNSIRSCIEQARESARTVREVLPAAIWEQLNTFRHLVISAARDGSAIQQPYDFCESVRMASHLLYGIATCAMLRDEAWLFLQAGRHIERADKTSRIVDVQYYLLLPNTSDVGSSIDINRWSSLLSSADALPTYRRTHGRIAIDKVAQFLILEPNFPRSIRFCIEKVEDSILKLKGLAPGMPSPLSEPLIAQLRAKIVATSIDEIIADGMHTFIDHLQGTLNSVGNMISNDFFDIHSQRRRLIQPSHFEARKRQTQTQS